MYPLYKLGIRLYYFLLWLIAPFHPGAAEWLKSRKIQEKENVKKIQENRPVIWFHASSLGEFEQALPLINLWKDNRPDHFILLTFYSPSGYKIRQDFPGADCVMYLPRDIKSEVRPFLDHFHPDRVVLIKNEIWPVLLKELAHRRIPTYLVSAVFRPDQMFFKRYGRWYLSLLDLFTTIFVQDQASAQLLEKNGINNVIISGDTRIDRVVYLAGDNSSVEGIDQFIADNKIIIAGSSWQREEQFLHRFFFESNAPGVKLILAPHDVSARRLKSIEDQFGATLIRYGQLLKQPTIGLEKSVLLIDRIGLLSKLYRYGHIAVIGGAFGAGLHNVLEPAVFGLPLIFGPRYHKFVEAVELVKCRAGFSVKTYNEFQNILQILVNDHDNLSNAGKGCRLFAENNKGATDLIISHLLEKA